MSNSLFNLDERHNEIGILGGIVAAGSSFYLAGNLQMALIHGVFVAIMLAVVTRFISRNLTFIIIVGGLIYLAYR